MQYRKFGSSNIEISALGFGAMRMPVTTKQPGTADIDEKKSSRMIYHAIESGVNYIDTAYPYHRGASEPFLGRILQGGWRDKVHLATKMPHWMMSDPAQFDTYFDEQLTRLQTDHIDFYLLHSIDAKSWEKLRQWDVLSWAEKRLAEGRIGQIGFSFHDNFAAFKTIVDAYDWSFCQIQHNYMDIDEQAGTKGLKYAASKGLAVVIMEPLLGGRLSIKQTDVQKIWNRAAIKRTSTDWALQWLWNQPEVSLVLSGMSTMRQVEQNLASASASQVGLFTPADQVLVDEVRAKYRELCLVSCTGCQYCQPCPAEINIPLMFDLYNAGHMYNALKHVRGAYAGWIPAEKRADHCLKCQECESKCPQHLKISELLEKVDLVLDQGKSYQEVLN
jgi:predicted aldo/keto reductase-like oxidoreductase